MWGGREMLPKERDSGQVCSASFYLTRRRGPGSHVYSRTLQRGQGRKGVVQTEAPRPCSSQFLLSSPPAPL